MGPRFVLRLFLPLVLMAMTVSMKSMTVMMMAMVVLLLHFSHFRHISVPEPAGALRMHLLRQHGSAELTTYVLIRDRFDPGELATNRLAVRHFLLQITSETRACSESELGAVTVQFDHGSLFPAPVGSATARWESRRKCPTRQIEETDTEAKVGEVHVLVWLSRP